VIPIGFKPNLSATLTKPEAIEFPVYASPKIDGIRCTVFDGAAYSRSLKLIPNAAVQEWTKNHVSSMKYALDGELVVGEANAPDCMQKSMEVMRIKGEPNFTFHVFDLVDRLATYEQRLARLIDRFANWSQAFRVKLVPQYLASNHSDLDRYKAMFLEAGYEGMMIRRPYSLYKFGRSTERSGGLTKVKRFTDAEAEVIGFEEELHNANEPTKDALGRTERSTQLAGLTGKGTLGALRCRTAEGIEFNIGTGFTAAQRRDFWYIRAALLGQFVTFKYFAHGVKEAPRHPVWKSFRHTSDMS
jgi:DNA ligase-1